MPALNYPKAKQQAKARATTTPALVSAKQRGYIDALRERLGDTPIPDHAYETMTSRAAGRIITSLKQRAKYPNRRRRPGKSGPMTVRWQEPRAAPE